MNELKQIDEFREVLAHYQLSETAAQTLAQTELVLLVGPTSSGRNTIINELVKTGDFHYIVSDTTRQPRSNNGILEQNGREYWFREEAELLQDLRNGNFLEAAIIHNQQVSGISIRELEVAAVENKIAINEIEIVGADNIHQAKPDAHFIFVLPPSFDVWMTRMRGRGSLPEDEVRRRLESAETEILTALEKEYYTFLVNDDYQHAAQQIQTIVTQDATSEAQQLTTKQLANELLAATRKYLQAS
jgi:guanylate kinase